MTHHDDEEDEGWVKRSEPSDHSVGEYENRDSPLINPASAGHLLAMGVTTHMTRLYPECRLGNAANWF
jgi:hypothetical protein